MQRLPPDHVMLGMEIWRRSTLRLYVSWNFVSGAIIIGSNHWGLFNVLRRSLATASRFQWGWYVHTVGFTRSVGFHPRLWSFAPTALFHGATAFQRYRGFLAINHRGGLFVCFSCHRSAVQVWGDMLPGGYVLNGLHPRLLSIRTYGALPGCFVLVGQGA